jgi:hypothetical protein
VTRPTWPQGGTPDAGRPQIYDEAPPQWTGVPLERDPVTGKLLDGDPLGRGDKGRSTSSASTAKIALIAGAAVAVVAAVVVAVVLFTGGDDEPGTVAAPVATSEAPTTSAAPTTTEPPVDTGPREIPVTATVTTVTPPPGFGPDPTYGTPGDQLPGRTWILTGACDGSGPCDVQHCQAPGQCGVAFTGQPQGGQYVGTFTSPVQWGAPECTGGEIDNIITFTLTGEGDAVRMTGTWVEQADQVLFVGSDGRDCGLYLAEFALSSP